MKNTYIYITTAGVYDWKEDDLTDSKAEEEADGEGTSVLEIAR